MPSPTRTSIPIGGLVVDYSNQAFDIEWAKTSGALGVITYINGTLGRGNPSPKCVTPRGLARITGLGLGFAPVWEQSATEFLKGYADGLADGIAANADCKVLGYPTTETVVVAFDSNVTAANIDQAVRYWDGFRDGCAHPLGAYGDYDIFERIKDRGCVLFCQAAAAAWSWQWVKDKFIRRTHPSTNLLQKVGYMVDPSGRNADRNICTRPFEMWTGNTPNPPTPDEDDMTPTIISVTGAHAQFLGQASRTGAFTDIEWTGPGSDPRVPARIAALKAQGAQFITVPLPALKAAVLHGALPVGDSRVWTAADFFAVQAA